MNEACSTYGRQEKCTLSFCTKTSKKEPLVRPRRRWEDIKETSLVGKDWIHMAQDTNQCRALVNMVMNLRVPTTARNVSTTRPSASEDPCFVKSEMLIA
jgi:hypothetical protein